MRTNFFLKVSITLKILLQKYILINIPIRYKNTTTYYDNNYRDSSSKQRQFRHYATSYCLIRIRILKRE